MLKVLKWIIFILLTLITIGWIILTLDIMKVIVINWTPFNDIRSWVLGYVSTEPDKIGLIALLTGGSVFFAYNAISIVIKKIPIIGGLWGWITGIVNALAVITIVVGVLLMVYL